MTISEHSCHRLHFIYIIIVKVVERTKAACQLKTYDNQVWNEYDQALSIVVTFKKVNEKHNIYARMSIEVLKY